MIVSIDIGTSYSSICMPRPDGKVHPVDISTGASMFGSKYSLPSAVFVEDSGNVLVGQAAMNSRKHKPQNFRMEFKRNLGEDIPILLGERSFKPEELYTELFRHMKACAEKVSGETIEKAYLTYPASYGEKRREKLCSAAKAAGLFDLELVDEPTAAAMCYCAEGYIKDGQTLLIYDFGGGTFDVSLIKYQNNEFQLLSEPTGLERCGGMDIDYLIAQDMREAIEKEIPGSWDSLQKNQSRFLRFTSQINELAVKAKHHLSSASVFEEYIEMGMDDVPYQLTVERFNEMIASLLGQTLQTCRRALDEAGISASDVSAVLMVGGTSRIPLVREMARKITGKPALCAADLELAVVQGALMYNESQKREQGPGRVQIREAAPKGAARETEFVLRTPSEPPERPAKPAMLTFPDPSDKPALWEFYWKNANQLLHSSTPVQANHLVVLEDGTVWENIVSVAGSVGLQADGTVVTSGRTAEFKVWHDIVSIANNVHTVGLRSDGTVVAVAAGIDPRGKCNVKDWHNIVLINCDAWHTAGLRSDGTVVVVGDHYHKQRNVQSWQNIVSITSSYNHIVGLRSDGTVVDDFRSSELQDWRDIVSVACGMWHTVGLRADGTVVAVGRNNDGQCNVQSWRNIVSIACGTCYTVGLRSDGAVVATGKNDLGQCNVRNYHDVIAVRVIRDHTIVLLKDGTITMNNYSMKDRHWFGDIKIVKKPLPPKTLPYKLF